MEHAYLRTLLEDARSALGVLFEHGFSQSLNSGDELGKLAERFTAAGMDTGSARLEALAQKLEQSRFQARTDWSAAAADYAGLWRYLSVCTDRLDYLQAAAALLDAAT